MTGPVHDDDVLPKTHNTVSAAKSCFWQYADICCSSEPMVGRPCKAAVKAARLDDASHLGYATDYAGGQISAEEADCRRSCVCGGQKSHGGKVADHLL